MVKKRSGGDLVSFDISKIENAIYKAMCDVGCGDIERAKVFASMVTRRISSTAELTTTIDIEKIQDEVERVLMQHLPKVAKSYILYREQKAKKRAGIASALNVPVEDLDDVSKKNLTVNSAGVFAARYLLRDLKTGEINETMQELFERVAKHIAIVDVVYSDYIFEKNSVYPHKTVDFDSLLTIYRTYTDDDKNPFLNEIYLKHVYNFFIKIKEKIAISFDEFFFIMFTHLESKTVRSDVIAYGYNMDELKEAQDALLSLFEERVLVYHELMENFYFLPNTPTLMNAGTDNGQLCACFTLDIKDDMRSIFKTVGDTAIIFQGAGGVGINFSKLRPVGDSVGNVPNAATGPMSFQSIINFTTDIIKQGGKRKGANMGILETWHPQIEEWITMKTIPKVMENYNISVGIDADFWECYDKGIDYPLVNPRNGEVTKMVNSHQLFDLIADSAWRCAEPGVIYFDNVNKNNPLKSILGDIKITNPCAEQAMYPNNSCTLGSINLAKYVNDDTRVFDYDKFMEDVYTTTQFLDNVLDINNYPTPEIENESLKIRRIGLGYMGLAHALYKMRIPYNSKEGFAFIERISTTLTNISLSASSILAAYRGAHYYWNEMKERNQDKSLIDLAYNSWTENKFASYINRPITEESLTKNGIRNTWTTTIAPTGTISMAADTSNGIEPVYSLVSVKNTSIGKFYNIDKEFVKALKQEGLYSEELLDKVAQNHGSCKGLVPEHLEKVFVTAVDIHWLDHLMALARAQKGISNSISKTINLPSYATVDDFKLAYLLAHHLGIKGLALYRDGSRGLQVMDVSTTKDVKDNEHKNPFDKHLTTEIGEKGIVKNAVIETTPSQVSLDYVIKTVTEKMDSETGKFILDVLEKNKVIEVSDLRVNTDKKCPLCGEGLIQKARCISCSSCDYGFCS